MSLTKRVVDHPITPFQSRDIFKKLPVTCVTTELATFSNVNFNIKVLRIFLILKIILWNNIHLKDCLHGAANLLLIYA